MLSRQGLVPVTLSQSADKKSRGEASKGPKLVVSRKQKMKTSEVLSLTVELSDLLASGMTLGNALNCLSMREEQGVREQILAGLRDEIVQGKSLSDALASYPETFPKLYVNMVRAGEASGAVHEVLQRLVEHYEKIMELREKTISALIYPAFVMFMGVVVLVFALVYIIPKFEQIFKDLGGSLPTSTRILMSLSDWMVRYGLFVLGGIVVAIELFRRYIRTPSGKLWWDGLKLKMPLIKGIVACSIFSNFARTLQTLMVNGVPVLQALRITENTVGNAMIAKELHNVRERVTDGTSISGPLASGKVFPSLMTDMLMVGEQTGDMAASLGHIAKRYENELSKNIKRLTTAIEPAMIVIVAVLVAFVAYSVVSAVFSVTSGVGGM
jgi:type II secretory pathway component PulF